MDCPNQPDERPRMTNDTKDYGFLQHGQGTNGPFRTEQVQVRSIGAGEWQASFEGRWRKVHILVRGLYIIFHGERIAIQIDGV
jgi:hypothetical protein